MRQCLTFWQAIGLAYLTGVITALLMHVASYLRGSR